MKKIYYKIRKEKGSLTVEASIALPIFIMALIMIAYIMQAVFVKDKAYGSMYSAARHLAIEAADEDKNISSMDISNSVANYSKIPLNNMSLANSSYRQSDKIIDINSKLNIKIAGINFVKKNLSLKQHISTRGFTGDENSKNVGEMVFVAKTGTVYHTHIDCSYIDIKVHEVALSEIDKARNSQGGKYYPCERCNKKGLEKTDKVYVTKTGTAYHYQATCSSIKREVSVVDKRTLGGMAKCSRCSTRD